MYDSRPLPAAHETTADYDVRLTPVETMALYMMLDRIAINLEFGYGLQHLERREREKVNNGTR